MARASADSPTVAPGAKRGNPDLLGPLAGGEWKAPIATVNPGVLIPDDASGSGPPFKSSFGANAFPSANSPHSGSSQVAAAKPIEMVELHRDSPLSDEPVAVAPAPKSETKRVVTVALAALTLLAFRKFRRRNTGMPPKPSFL